LAFKKYPEINVTFEGEELVYHDEINIAVGVGTSKGLRAPVIKDADRKTIEELTRIINEFAEKGDNVGGSGDT
jgi:pyruvate/2-oxoglutarate dehydrogenase complex dihydrolipoamide acyltransferase (E2) component